MSYAKPVKQCQDAPFGIRSANGLARNQLDTKAVLELEHTEKAAQPIFTHGHGGQVGAPVQIGSTAGLDLTNGGEHDTPKVARGTMSVVFDTNIAVGQSTMRVRSQSGVCTDLIHVSTGSYFLPVAGLSSFAADVLPRFFDITVPRLTQQIPATDATGGPGIYISTWQQSTLLSGNVGFALADYDFDIVVFGFRDEVARAADALAVARRTPLSAKPFSRGPFKRHPGR